MPNLTMSSIIVTRFICQDPDQEQVSDQKRNWIVTALTGSVTWAAAVGAIDAAVGPFLGPCLNDHALYLGTLLRQQSPTVTDGWAIANASPVTGTGGANRMPGQVCGLIRLKTGGYGRRYEGRFYVPFPATDANVNGEVSAGYSSDMGDLGAWLTAPITITSGGSATLTPVLVPSSGAIASLPWTTYVVPGVFATQRRRGAYGRFNLAPI